MYHTEGAGGGHAPDIIRCNGEPHCLPSSTNPTNPFTRNAFDEHLDMMMLCHQLSPDVPEDVAFADSRLRPQTMAAEDVLHDLGAISMMGSDSEGMGRVAEVVLRTWQLAAKMKDERGPLAGEPYANADNARILRYIAKYTINAARTFGIDAYIGSLEPGKMADIVLWQPAFFGVKPAMVIKGGMMAWGPMGDAAVVGRDGVGALDAQRGLRAPPRAGRRPGRPARHRDPASAARRHPEADQARHAAQRRLPRYPRRFAILRGLRRRRLGGVGAGRDGRAEPRLYAALIPRSSDKDSSASISTLPTRSAICRSPCQFSSM
jgi:hypothetical protein